jgi:ligand-binding sensor domain-containing protein
VVNDKEFGGVFVTHDGGAHWQQMNAGLAGHDIFSLAQAADGDLLAGTHRGVYLYERKLARWRPINSIVNEKIVPVPVRGPKLKNAKLSKTNVATRREYVRSELKGRVARVIVSGDRWYAATAEGVFASYDHGQTWHGGPVDSMRNFFSIDAEGENVVATTPDGMAISHHHGNAWTAVSVPSYISPVQAVALSPSAIWLSSRSGVFFSKDDGATWEHVLVGAPPENLMSVRYDHAAQRLLGLTRSGQVYSAHEGQPWNRTADAGIQIRSISPAGGRLLGITPFRGIVAEPELQTPRAAASAGGSR